MSKNVNNDVSMNPPLDFWPIRIHHHILSAYLSKSHNFKNFIFHFLWRHIWVFYRVAKCRQHGASNTVASKLNVMNVWPGLDNTEWTMLRYIGFNCCNRFARENNKFFKVKETSGNFESGEIEILKKSLENWNNLTWLIEYLWKLEETVVVSMISVFFR